MNYSISAVEMLAIWLYVLKDGKVRKRATYLFAIAGILLVLASLTSMEVFAAPLSRNIGTVITTHNAKSYDNILIQTLIDAEIGPSSKNQQKVISPYDDGVGNPTIGIGYNLKVQGVFQAVAVYFGVDPKSNLLDKKQKATVNGYVTQMTNVIAAYDGDISTLDTALNQVMDSIKSDASLPVNFKSAVYSAFAFNDLADAENTGLFTTIESSVLHEERALSNALGSSDFSNSLERATLISLQYNGIKIAKSPKLTTDISNGNRAEAWYEVRYNTDASNDSQNASYNSSIATGVAIRRDYESDLFGLYNGDPFSNSSTVTNDEATPIAAMVLAHEKQLFQSVIPDKSSLYNNRYFVDPNTLIANTNTNYVDAISAVDNASDVGESDFKVRNLTDNLAPAVNYLLTSSGAQGAGNVLVFQQADKIDLSAYKGMGIAAFVQNSGVHQITMNNGSDLIYTNANDTIVLGAGVDQLTLQGATTTVDASHLTQAANPDLLIDNITFGGAVIGTGDDTLVSGSTDAYGRTYTLSGAVLTITKGSSSVTIKGFENDDFGVDIQPAYTFTQLNVPTGTVAIGINDAGTIVGGGFDSGPGFVGTQKGGFKTFDYQPGPPPAPCSGCNWDVATGVNNNGQIVGYSGVADYAINNPDTWLSTNGAFSNIVAPDSQSTFAYGINDNGQVVGQYADNTSNSGLHGFLYSGGAFTTMDEPGAAVTNLLGINDSGQIVGSSNLGSFLYTPGANGKPATFTLITTPTGGSTFVKAINNNGQMTGYFYSQSNVYGFIYDGKNFTQFALPGANGAFAYPTGINDSGDIILNDYGTLSFIGVPAPTN